MLFFLTNRTFDILKLFLFLMSINTLECTAQPQLDIFLKMTRYIFDNAIWITGQETVYRES